SEVSTGLGTSSEASDSDGAFLFADVSPGRYRLKAIAEDFAPQQLEITVDENDLAGLQLVLGEPVELVMSPRRSDGSIPGRVVLRLFDGDGRQLNAEARRPDESGVIRFRQLNAGTWSAALKDDHNNEMPLLVEIPGDAGTVTIPPSGRLLLNAPDLAQGDVPMRYRLLDADGRPYLGTADFSHWIHPDAQNLRLPVGNWTLELETGDGQSWRLPVTVADSTDTELVIP
ncbi:MAG: carboxypeptidase-like regulatory domain-containing protein, partial [Acidobacteriota bacterium]